MVEDVGQSSTNPKDTGRPPPSTMNINPKVIREITLYKGTPNIKTKTMYVPIKVGNKQVSAVIDSGAQVSVISEKLFECSSDKPKLTNTVFIRGIGTTNRIRARVVENIPLKIGSINMNWNMLVADVTDTLILGLDFLEGNKVVIDHGQFNISINQELIPARYTSNDENEDIQIYRIKVTRTVVIPPYSVQCVETNLNLQPREDIVIQPSPSLGEMLTPMHCSQPSKKPIY